jgi:S1-C subfamily serine protease
MDTKNKQNHFNNPIVIILTLVLVGISGYFLFNKNISTPEIETQTSQKEELETLRQEIEKLKSDTETTKANQDNLQKKVSSQNNKQTQSQTKESIIGSEIQKYLDEVGWIVCMKGGEPYSTGSGWLFRGDFTGIITNDHVIEGSVDHCLFFSDPLAYKFNQPFKVYDWNSFTDAAFVKVDEVTRDDAPRPEKLSLDIMNLSYCPDSMPLGSPVAIIGYPASTQQQFEENSLRGNKTITDGVISSLDDFYDSSTRKPFSDYFVSAKIDSGNSGGLALSKSGGKICLLGIPTWLNIGNYDSQGIVQNIRNITYR